MISSHTGKKSPTTLSGTNEPYEIYALQDRQVELEVDIQLECDAGTPTGKYRSKPRRILFKWCVTKNTLPTINVPYDKSKSDNGDKMEIGDTTFFFQNSDETKCAKSLCFVKNTSGFVIYTQGFSTEFFDIDDSSNDYKV